MRARAFPSRTSLGGVTPLPDEGRYVRLALGMLTALLLSVHLVGVHVGHSDHLPHSSAPAVPTPADPRAATDDTASVNAWHEAGSSHSQVQAAAEHEDLDCGDAAPARDWSTPGWIIPSLKVLWALEPLAHTYLPPAGPERPRRTPCPVRELGVLRV